MEPASSVTAPGAVEKINITIRRVSGEEVLTVDCTFMTGLEIKEQIEKDKEIPLEAIELIKFSGEEINDSDRLCDLGELDKITMIINPKNLLKIIQNQE